MPCAPACVPVRCVCGACAVRVCACVSWSSCVDGVMLLLLGRVRNERERKKESKKDRKKGRKVHMS